MSLRYISLEGLTEDEETGKIIKVPDQKMYLQLMCYSAPQDPYRLSVKLRTSANEYTGLMELLIEAGAIRQVGGAFIQVNQWGSKAYLVELMWPDSAMDSLWLQAED
eukprot:gene1593-32981_t